MSSGDVPEQVAGYPVVRLLGAGGMGVVYLVRHPRIRRLQALKVIAPHFSSDPVLRQRFLREAEIAAAVEHPSLVSIYDQDERDGVLHLSMQWVDGPDLARLLRGGRPPSPAEVALGVQQVAAALDTVHAMGLVHRDVKCSNILVAGRGSSGSQRWVLSDFGIARALDQTTDLTGAGLVGSVPYCAPERFDGDPGSAASDVYALACVAAEALTGKAPFGSSLMSVVRAHARAEPPQNLGLLPPAVAELLRHGLAQDPASRPASAGVFADALAVELARWGSTAGTTTGVPRHVASADRPGGPPAAEVPTADAVTHLAPSPTPAPESVDAAPTAAPAAAAASPAAAASSDGGRRTPPRGGGRPPAKRGRRVPVLGATLVVAGLVAGAVWGPWGAPADGAEENEPSPGSSSSPSSSPGASLAAATATTARTAATAEDVSAGPAPWSAAPLDAGQVPAVALDAWRSASADARATCPLLLPADSAGAPEGSVRQPDFSGDWAVTWDVPGTPGTLSSGEESATAGRSTYGIAGVPITWDDSSTDDAYVWPENLTWADGSTAGYGPEGGSATTSNTVAYVTVAGHEKCLYNVWSHLGQSHLEALLAALRYVDTGT